MYLDNFNIIYDSLNYIYIFTNLLLSLKYLNNKI